MEQWPLPEDRKFKAFTREPESMCVADLNQAVKDLREALYQKQLELQHYIILKAELMELVDKLK